MSETLTLILTAVGLAGGAILLIKLTSRGDGAGAVPAPASPPVAAPAPVAEEGIPAHHLVIIAAAAHAMVGAHRILHIGAAESGHLWSAEGRLAQHTSHHPHH